MAQSADPAADPIERRYRVPPGADRFRLDTIRADEKPLFPERAAAETATAAAVARIVELQTRLYAGAQAALLVVFQAMDTGGKDGVIRKIFGPLDPLGATATSFKAPSAEERAHDYLWRVHRAAPALGTIGIFNRSHYEDVLIARVRQLAPAAEIERRYGQINAFERHLAENRTTILKFYLHISKDEQRKRLQARLDDPEKHWKFDPGDLAERARWDEYREAYEIALGRCSTESAPWHVVPADRKWHRDAVVAHLVRNALERMKLAYPKPAFDPAAIVIR